MNKYRVCKLVASYRCWCHCLKHEWMYSYNIFEWLWNILLCYKNPSMNEVPGLWKCCMGPLEAELILRSCTVEPMLDPPGDPCSGHSFDSFEANIWINRRILTHSRGVKSGHNLSTQHVNRSQTIIFYCLHQ